MAMITSSKSTGDDAAEANISLGVLKYISGVLSNRYPHALYSSRSTIEIKVRRKRMIDVKERMK